ncbi:MAG: SusD/RagB family nutrient-binding outer rane lipoprotein [Ferruginibacter sp.]|nr:SusD/RagB family nutrient-binding outer rane lipoprotein [Ferruginibacter sp.]
MKKTTYLFIAIAVILSSCAKGFKELNTDPTQFLKVSPESLIETAVKRTGDMIGGSGTNGGLNINMWEIANLIEPGVRYTAADQGIWQTSYVNILQNLVQLEKDYGKDSSFNNRVQIARIWKSYVYSILVGFYGPIPMAEANNPDNLSVINFESEDTVYTKILATLKDASSKIDVTKTTDKLTYDVVYALGSNPPSAAVQLLNWKKFANTLRLRVALRCRRNLGPVADAAIQELMTTESQLIGSEAETVKVPYEDVANNENPYYKVFTKATYTQPSPKLTDMLFVYFRSYKDPRINYYFDSVKTVAARYRVTDTLTSTLDDSLRIVNYPIPHYGLTKSNAVLPGWTSQLAGFTSPQGQSNPNGMTATSVYSVIAAGIYNNKARPVIILGYSEAQFLKAQAAMLGLGGAQTPEAYYTSGIDANFAFWAIPNGLRDAYKQVNGVKFGTTGTGFWNYLHNVKTDIPAGDINKIYFQTWLNFFPDQPFDAWCLQRQTRVLNLSPHTTPGFAALTFQDIPDRGFYPLQVSSQNPTGYSGALALLGAVGYADESTNPYIRLKFEAPYTVPDYNAIPVAFDNSAAMKWYGTTIQSLQSAAVANGFTVQITKTYK